MTPSRMRWLAAAALLLVLAAGYASVTRQIVVLADGRAHPLATRALTVRGALNELGIQLAAQDRVEPAGYMPVWDGLIIAVRRAARVQLHADGQLYTTSSRELNPAELLKDWGITLAEGDRLLLAGRQVTLDETLPSAPVLSLELRRPVAVTLSADGSTSQFTSSASTLGQALAENGFELQEADRLIPSADSPLDEPVSATLVRARPLSITRGEETYTLYSAAATVGEALAEAGIALQGDDYSQPEEDAAVPADGAIRVVRVTEAVQLVQETVPHQTEWQPDDSAELDDISVVQLGQDGVRSSRVRVRYEDGEEVSRQAEAERVLVEPLTQINGYGTQIVIRTAVVDGITIEYYRAVQVYATSYSPCRSGVPGRCFTGTSLGLPVKKGVIGTWYNWFIALGGHTVYVPGYGSGIIADVGAYTPNRSLHWIDLGYSDDDFEGWPLVPVTMYFTTPVPPDVPMTWPP